MLPLCLNPFLSCILGSDIIWIIFICKRKTIMELSIKSDCFICLCLYEPKEKRKIKRCPLSLSQMAAHHTHSCFLHIDWKQHQRGIASEMCVITVQFPLSLASIWELIGFVCPEGCLSTRLRFFFISQSKRIKKCSSQFYWIRMLRTVMWDGATQWACGKCSCISVFASGLHLVTTPSPFQLSNFNVFH